MTATATWYAVHGPNGDLTWRVQSPARAIGAKVNLIPDGENGFAQLNAPNPGPEFPWMMDVELENGSTERIVDRRRWDELCDARARIVDRRVVYPAHEGDAAVWTRPLAWGAAHMIEMRREHGIRVCAEVDDNYLSDKRLNVFMQKADWGTNDRDNHSRSVCVGDGLIVSTEYLRDAYWKGLKEQFGKKHLPEIFVCRNHIDERYIPEPIPPRPDGKLRIGYMGSDSHVWDVDLIFDALWAAYELGHEIVFVGIHPAWLNPKITRSKKPWHELPYTHIPWRNDGYRGDALPLDIGLAPLKVDKHTLGKSDIKWLEYGLSGAACVAQNCLVYNRTGCHGESLLLASSPAEYVTRTLDLLQSPSLRARLVAGTLQYIREERLLSRNKREWEEAVLG